MNANVNSLTFQILCCYIRVGIRFAHIVSPNDLEICGHVNISFNKVGFFLYSLNSSEKNET